MPILAKLSEYLDRNQVRYEVLSHRQAFTAQEVAAEQHVHGKDLAKVVMLRSGAELIMAVLPAPYRVDMDRARTVLGKPDLVLATEEQFRDLFPGCEPGAMPPFGNLYDMPVYADESLAADKEINHVRWVKLLLEILVDGFVISALYSLGAAGFTIIFGVSGVLNLAHGGIMVIAAMVAWLVAGRLALHHRNRTSSRSTSRRRASGWRGSAPSDRSRRPRGAQGRPPPASAAGSRR